jgi:hypothetical protein
MEQTPVRNWPHRTFSDVLEKETNMNKTTDTANKNNAPAQQPNKGPEKHKKFNEDDDTRNTGFRSSRVRESESRTQDTGDPSIP